MNEYSIAETRIFQKRIESKTFKRYYLKIKNVIYPKLRKTPYYGPNIKRLKGDLSSIFRYRIGDLRLFYTIDPREKKVFILDIVHRKNAYR